MNRIKKYGEKPVSNKFNIVFQTFSLSKWTNGKKKKRKWKHLSVLTIRYTDYKFPCKFSLIYFEYPRYSSQNNAHLMNRNPESVKHRQQTLQFNETLSGIAFCTPKPSIPPSPPHQKNKMAKSWQTLHKIFIALFKYSCLLQYINLCCTHDNFEFSSPALCKCLISCYF